MPISDAKAISRGSACDGGPEFDRYRYFGPCTGRGELAVVPASEGVGFVTDLVSSASIEVGLVFKESNEAGC